MSPLSRREAVIYLRTKLISAGYENAEDVLSLDTCEDLHEMSGGWPGGLDEAALQTISSRDANLDTQSGPRIIVTSDGQTVAEYAISKSETIIGRDRSADIVINDARVSKHHAMLKVDETAVVLFDLNSTNGTRVNSMEIMQSLMQNDDIIAVGPYELKLENLPAISDKMAEKLRQADTVTLGHPDDIRRSRALRNIQRTRPHRSSSRQPVVVQTSASEEVQKIPSTSLASV